MPPWMQAEQISFGERMEILSYKLITYVPVMVTFGVFGFLFCYYSYVSKLEYLVVINRLLFSSFYTQQLSEIFMELLV